MFVWRAERRGSEPHGYLEEEHSKEKRETGSKAVKLEECTWYVQRPVWRPVRLGGRREQGGKNTR